MKSLGKIGLMAGSMFAILVSGTNMAQAHSFGAGLWELSDYGYEICLETNGTWYSPSLSDWGGYWQLVSGPGEKAGMIGSTDPGVENDSFVISGTHAHWNEWDSDYDYIGMIETSWAYEGANCSAAQKKGIASKTPMKR
jgi:hypothetical protein